MINDDGGCVFPQQRDELGNRPQDYGLGGMTLRDYFASSYEPESVSISDRQARELGLTHPQGSNELDWAVFRATVRAKFRYIEADAMLAERSKK
jgi:hypothetical protein